MKPDNIEILDNLVAEANNKIFNKFNGRAILPTFVRINNNTVINLSNVSSIVREYNENNEYYVYKDNVDSLLENVIKQYISEHPEILDNDKTPDNISTELYNKFYPVVNKNVIKDYGPWPDPFLKSYKIYMQNGTEYYCSDDEIVNQIYDLIGIDMTQEFEEEV